MFLNREQRRQIAEDLTREFFSRDWAVLAAQRQRVTANRRIGAVLMPAGFACACVSMLLGLGVSPILLGVGSTLTAIVGVVLFNQPYPDARPVFKLSTPDTHHDDLDVGQ